MFLNSHLRLQIPPTLGVVSGVTPESGGVFDRTVDPSTRVPDIIAFMNDSDMDVTLHFDVGNSKALITTTVDGSGNYTVGAGTAALEIAIDGEAPVSFNLTTGTRTIAQVCTDINAALAAAGGNTALARAIPNGTKYISIVSGSVGQFSSVQILAPASNSGNANLGLTVGTYTSQNSFLADIVSPLTIQSKGQGVFTNPRKNAAMLQIRGQVHDGTTGLSVMIDGTALFSYSGVQQ
jgi:hypothetical protein